MVRAGAAGRNEICKLGHSGTFWDIEKKARRHEGTQARSGDQAERERVRDVFRT